MVIKMEKIKVLIIDDSAVVRKILSLELSKSGDIEVIGTAPNPIIGRDKIVMLKPDVIILDVEMPEMDGLTFLEKLMKYHPMPVIILSSLAEEGGEVALKAVELGACEVLAKPGSSYSVKDMSEQLIEKVKAVSKIKNLKPIKISAVEKVEKKRNMAMIKTTNKIVAIGASTGGTEAIRDVLTKLPAETPPMVIVQHMPANFTKAFADRLNEICQIEVREAKNGDQLLPGTALIAPGNKHMEVRRSGANYFVNVVDGPLIYHQRPAVENLFLSVAKYVGSNAIGVILTGMGKDGSTGMLEMKKQKAFNIAQDEKSSIVFGMPKEAIELGAVDVVAPLEKIPELIMKHV